MNLSRQVAQPACHRLPTALRRLPVPISLNATFAPWQAIAQRSTVRADAFDRVRISTQLHIRHRQPKAAACATKVVPPALPVVNGEYHATYDYNGNLTSLRTPTGGTVARYEYGPFGESLTSRDVLAGTNPFRFSTKYNDPETGLLYYGYRYYNASLGRWMSRDPIEETGSVNIMLFCRNNSVHVTDMLGLFYQPTSSNGYELGYRDTPNSSPLDQSTWNTLSGGLNELEIFDIVLRAEITIRGGQALGYEDAANLLRHFLKNTGTPYAIDFHRMNEESEGANAWMNKELNLAMSAAEDLSRPNATILMRSTHEKVADPGNTSGNWLFAVGGYRTWGKGAVTQLGCEEYEMRYSFRMRDKYDWDANTMLKGGAVFDYEMAALHGYGRAKEFEVYGRDEMIIKWRKGQRFEEADVDSQSRRSRRRRDIDPVFPLG